MSSNVIVDSHFAGTAVDIDTSCSRQLKKRKIRKGTQSCWECKRRKIRCTFVSSEASVCDGCRSRHVRCIGQDFYDDNDSVTDTAPVHNKTVIPSQHSSLEARSNDSDRQYDPSCTSRATVSVSFAHHVPCASNILTWKKTRRNQAGRTFSAQHGIENTLARSMNGSISWERGRLDELCLALRAQWPKQEELDVLTGITVATPVLFHGTVCRLYADLWDSKMPTPRELLYLPVWGSHPVFLARKLLLLSSFLQGIPRGAIKDLGPLESRYVEIMSSTFDAASRLVISRDELVNSPEGVECIMIESMYHNNAGNLRQAWLTNRRAMSIAQVVGLHNGKSDMVPMLDASTKDRIDPECMWVRIITSDRYLSLMLGLPQGWAGNEFATTTVLESCSPWDKMERIQTAVGGLILERNKEDCHNLDHTYDIDKQLQQAATLVPASWWLFPDFEHISGSELDALKETIRSMSQFAYFHLLTRLHLPFILCRPSSSQYDYSRTTATHASREILSRFVRLRSSNQITVYCRGIDFLAFIACTTLCLAYIAANECAKLNNRSSTTSFHYLTHHRPTDRALAERTLDIISEMVQNGNDPIAGKISSILQRLLEIEAATLAGDCYRTVFTAGGDHTIAGQAVNAKNTHVVLHFCIPHIGTINIEQAIESQITDSDQSRESDLTAPYASRTGGLLPLYTIPAPPPSINHFGAGLPMPHTECAFSQVADSVSNQQNMAEPVMPSIQYEKCFDRQCPIESELMADDDQWILHGTDVALFDSLFDGLEAWP